MPILNNPSNPFTATVADALAPFNSIFGTQPEYRGPDFRSFDIQEILPLGQRAPEPIRLAGRMLPHQPFVYGGDQRLIKEYYPGNPEPTVQVLGGREDNITIKGRLYAKHYSNNEELRNVPEAIRDQLDGLRKRGSLVSIQLGEWKRWGFVESTKWNVKTRADIEYEIEFSIIGDKPPSECKMTEGGLPGPVEINKQLIAAALEFEGKILDVPSGISVGLLAQVNELMGAVATALSVVTKFVDVAVTGAENTRKLADRAIGLIKYAQSTISTFKRRVGALNAYLDSDPTSGIPTWNEATNTMQAKYVVDTSKSTSKPIEISPAMRAEARRNKVSKYTPTPATQTQAQSERPSYSIDEMLLQMRTSFESYLAFTPMQRHLVQGKETLAQLSVKYYNTPDNWYAIYQHNKLTSYALTAGQVLEIPRL